MDFGFELDRCQLLALWATMLDGLKSHAIKWFSSAVAWRASWRCVPCFLIRFELLF